MKSNSLSVSRVGHGAPIILLHGWGMSASVFAPLCSELSKTREVITVELPGYGASVWESGMSFADQVDIMVSELPAGELLGWSMGGLYAIQMVQRNSNKFNRLSLVCCNPCFVTRPDWDCAVEASVFDEFCQSLYRGWEITVKRFLSLQMHGNENARPLIRHLMALLALAGEPKLEVLQFGLSLLKNSDLRPALAGLEIPVKMILGYRDVLVPKGLAEEIYHVNPEIRVESLATAAHAPFLSHDVQFLAMLKA